MEPSRAEKRAYRIFISYSHSDVKLAEIVSAIFVDLGMELLWDKKLSIGFGFGDEIRTFIAHSHVFVPIITASSTDTGWVHQEIGYAVALNTPMLPIAEAGLPTQMLQGLHTIELPEDPATIDRDLRRRLTRQSIEKLVRSYEDEKYALYEVAEVSEDRAILLSSVSDSVARLDKTGTLRQKGGLSSLHIPEEPTSSPIWRERYGKRPATEYHCRLQRKERIALEHHARLAGFKIAIDPTYEYPMYGASARVVRLQTLLRMLQSLPEDDRYQVAFYPSGGKFESITILGDWFYSESVSASGRTGYRQTALTRHAPSMQSKVMQFDQEFDELLSSMGWTPEESRTNAVEHIAGLVSELQ